MGDINDNTNPNPENGQSDSIQDINLNQNPDLNPDYYQDNSLQQMNPNNGMQQTNETTINVPMKKKPHGKLIAALIAVVVLLTCSITAFANRNTLVNAFSQMTKSPVEYYASIEKKSFDKGIDKITSAYDKSLTQYKDKSTKGLAQNATIKLSLNPDFGTLIGLSDIGTVEAKITSLFKDKAGKSNIGISYNNKSIISMDSYIDMAMNNIYMKFPELSNAYLLLPLDELMAEADYTDSFSYQSYIDMIETLSTNKSITPEVVNSLLKKYSAIIISNIDDITLEKDVALTASGVTSKNTKITGRINGEDAYNMVFDLLTVASKDKDIVGIGASLSMFTEEEYNEAIQSALDELNSAKESMIASEETVLMNVYVDNAGNIIGREFAVTDDEAYSLGYYVTNKGSDYGFHAWASENDVNIVEFTGSATQSNNGYTGSAKFVFSEYNYTYEDYTNYAFDIAFKNANIVADSGYVNGKFTITSDLLAGMQIILDCSANQKQQNMIFDLMYANMKTVTVEINSKVDSYQDFTLPSQSDETYNAVSDSYSYLATMDIESFIAKTEEALGIDDLESYIDEIMSNFLY